MCNPQVSTHSWHFPCLSWTHMAEVEQDDALIVSSVLSEAYLVHVSHIFLLVILLLKTVPKHGTEVLF